jgi:NADPH-dependent 2,4-dienoyl-CoA reductase/sulfur reductase-like enzyme
VSRHYLILGLGAAGVSAAEAIRSLDATADILLVSDDAHGYYSRPGLAYYLTGELRDDALYPFTEQDFQERDLRRLQARAVALHPGSHQLELHDGRRLDYDRLLLATGSRAFQPPLPGIDLEGVVKLDDMADAHQIVERCRKARSGVVVGGGITALELAEGLHARRVHTRYFLRSERYWGNVLAEAESQIVEQRLQERGVEIDYHTEVVEILGHKGHVAAVRTRDGRTIECDLLAIAIGVRPRLGVAQSAGLDIDRGILVDEHLQASVPDVFAAGDVAQVYDPLSGRSVLDTLWGIAIGQGRIAGRNLAGGSESYVKGVPFNVTRLAELTTTIIGAVGSGRGGDRDDLVGIARGDSETWRHRQDAVIVQDEFEVNRIRLLVSGQAIAGAIVMGDQTLSRPLQHLVAGQVDISPILEKLLHPEAPLGDLIHGFWTEWRSGRDPA